MPYSQHGFVRLAVASPMLKVANPLFNIQKIVELWKQADEQGAALIVFPELCISGYTCGDLFGTKTLQQECLTALLSLCDQCRKLNSVAIVGLPIVTNNELFNAAAVIHQGKVLGFVPKSYLPTYKEFYEHRWFANAAKAPMSIVFDHRNVPCGSGLIFACESLHALQFTVEICEDLWVPIPPSSSAAMAGATVICNLSASNDLIGKANYRRQLVHSQSARCVTSYLYASCGVTESTTDVVFGGHLIISEYGQLIAESSRFEREGSLVLADVDLERLALERKRTGSFSDGKYYHEDSFANSVIPFTLNDLREFPSKEALMRSIEPHPFVPAQDHLLAERCEEIFNIQAAGLGRRIEHAGNPKLSMGISGGLDSTLSLLVTCKTLDQLKLPRTQLQAFTMPGFGTTSRTLENARILMKELGVTAREVDIRQLCIDELRALGHSPFGIDLTSLSIEQLTERFGMVPADKRYDLVFENVQARMRTSILMNSGFVVGTGDLSELALGWCTYNGDHMSMYNPNVSVPKTLVKFLVRWLAQNQFEGRVRQVLIDITETEISPELLPAEKTGKSTQNTEESVGPYELQDFYLYHFLRWGFGPSKLLWLACRAKFDRSYLSDELKKWLAVFFKRFFANQFKRSCLPDGPKIGSVSLSPRGDWRMPSDASVEEWISELR